MPNPRVLVAEDDESMKEFYQGFFEVAHKDEFAWCVAAEGETALELLRRRPFDVLVLDLNLPGISGLDVLRLMQQDCVLRSISVIIVSAQSKVEERVAGLRAGADDYLPKPFKEDELWARLESIVRARQKNLLAHGIYDLGWLKLRPDTLQVTVDGQPVHLEPKELALLLIFLRRPDMIHRSQDLHEMVWKFPGQDPEHAVGSRVSSLRQKLGRGSDCLISHKGIGYSFDTRLSPQLLRSPA